MQNQDPRIAFILSQLDQAGKKINPESMTPIPSEADVKGMALCLEMFDRMLPMLVRAAITEYENQKAMR